MVTGDDAGTKSLGHPATGGNDDRHRRVRDGGHWPVTRCSARIVSAVRRKRSGRAPIQRLADTVSPGSSPRSS